jgi:hypothetical protein
LQFVYIVEQNRSAPIATGVSEMSLDFEWPDRPGPDRRASVLTEARQQGLAGTKDKTIGGRVPAALVEAAKARSGIQSDSELLLYALSKVALEDDFGTRLLALKGSVPKDVVLDV